jgi:hypothetical protein
MIAAAFFTWWYGQGWELVFKNTKRHLHQTAQLFSAVTLIQTLFAPWRRITSYPGAGINDHVRAFFDNLVSRAVGFTVRLFVLIAALIALIAVSIVAVVEIVTWPLIPIAIVAGIVRGVI